MEYIAEVIQTLLSHITLGMSVLVLTVFVGGVVFIVSVRRKGNRLKEDLTDYSQYDRYDVLSYVGDDEFDIDEDMAITNGGTRFVAAIEVAGFDYFGSSEEMRRQCILAYRELFPTITDQLKMVYYAKPVDLEERIACANECSEQRAQDIYRKSEQFEQLKRASEHLGSDQMELYQGYLERLLELREDIETDCGARDLLLVLKRYMEEFSGDDAEYEYNSAYIFDWIYRPSDFATYGMMSPEEVRERAKEELHKKASVYIGALRNAGLRARRLTTNELIDLERHHYSPYSANMVSMADIAGHSAFLDIAPKSQSLPEDEAMYQPSKLQMDALLKMARDRKGGRQEL